MKNIAIICLLLALAGCRTQPTPSVARDGLLPFDEASYFREGLAAVKMGGKWGYIDRSGKEVIYPYFDAAGEFWEGLAVVKVGEKP
ncbi:MAG: WG repeat-containing protein, partial [bacterium]